MATPSLIHKAKKRIIFTMIFVFFFFVAVSLKLGYITLVTIYIIGSIITVMRVGIILLTMQHMLKIEAEKNIPPLHMKAT